MKLTNLFSLAYLLIIVWNTTGCSEKGISQKNNNDSDKFDLTMCRWIVDSLTFVEPSLKDGKEQSTDEARISNLFLKELYEAKDDLIYFEFKENGRAFFSFVDSVIQEKFNFSYNQSDSQIFFSFTDTSSSQVLSFSVDYYFSPNKDYPQILINDSDYLIFFLSCGGDMSD